MRNMEKNLGYYLSLPYKTIIEPRDDADKPYFVARVVELPYCAIDGDTPENALKELEEVKVDWLKSNLTRGLKIPEPAVRRKISGKTTLRIPPYLHQMLADRADAENISLNEMMSSLLSNAVGHPGTRPETRKKGKKTAA